MTKKGQSGAQKRALSTSTVILLASFLMVSSLLFLGYLFRGPEEFIKKSIIPWGLLVPGYAFFALAATGVSTINSLPTIFGYKGKNGMLVKMLKRGAWISLATIIPAWLLIIFDLGRPDHFPWMILSFQPSSRIAWMALLYALFAIAVLVELIHLIRNSGEHEKAHAAIRMGLGIGVLVLFFDLAVDGNLGQIFGSSVGTPAWFGPWMGAFFVALAVLLGSALYVIIISMAVKFHSDKYSWEEIKECMRCTFSKIFLLALVAVAFFEVWMLYYFYYFYEPAFHVLTLGELAPVFWIGSIALGLALPAILIVFGLLKKNYQSVLVAALLIFIFGFFTLYSLVIGGGLARINYVLPGRINPYNEIFGSVAFSASLPEVMMLVGGTTLWLFLYLLGEILLPLEHGEKPRRWILKW